MVVWALFDQVSDGWFYVYLTGFLIKSGGKIHYLSIPSNGKGKSLFYVEKLAPLDHNPMGFMIASCKALPERGHSFLFL